MTTIQPRSTARAARKVLPRSLARFGFDRKIEHSAFGHGSGPRQRGRYLSVAHAVTYGIKLAEHGAAPTTPLRRQPCRPFPQRLPE
jgi:hypothetical protein